MTQLKYRPEQITGVNVMTNKNPRFYLLDNGLYAELAEGTGIQGEAIFGVTIRDKDGKDGGHLSGLHFSRHDAEMYLFALEDESEVVK